jgi:hypothetical protein
LRSTRVKQRLERGNCCKQKQSQLFHLRGSLLRSATNVNNKTEFGVQVNMKPEEIRAEESSVVQLSPGIILETPTKPHEKLIAQCLRTI